MPKDKNGGGIKAASAAVRLSFVLCLALIGLFVAIDVMLIARGASFVREGGGLENVSAVLYVVSLVVFFRLAPPSNWRRLWHIPTLMMLFALRELDFDKAFTEAGVLSLKLYSGNAAWHVKMTAGAVALFVLVVVLRSMILGGPAAVRAVRHGQNWAWFVFLAVALLVSTKTLDGLARKLMGLGIIISDDLDAVASLVEETGEVFIPVCAILAMVACWRGTHDHTS